jgi:hypothetical protein
MVAADGTRRRTADRSDAVETPRKQHHRHDYRREQHHAPHAPSLVLPAISGRWLLPERCLCGEVIRVEH